MGIQTQLPTRKKGMERHEFTRVQRNKVQEETKNKSNQKTNQLHKLQNTLRTMPPFPRGMQCYASLLRSHNSIARSLSFFRFSLSPFSAIATLSLPFLSFESFLSLSLIKKM